MTPWTPPYLGDENSDQTSTLSCFKLDKIPNKLFLSEIALKGRSFMTSAFFWPFWTPPPPVGKCHIFMPSPNTQ